MDFNKVAVFTLTWALVICMLIIIGSLLMGDSWCRS